MTRFLFDHCVQHDTRQSAPPLSVASTSIPSASSRLISLVLPRVAASQFSPVAAFHSAGLFFLATGSTGLTSGTGRAGAWAVGFEGVASGTGCAGARVTGSRGFTGVLLADSWAGCAPHPTISTVTIAVMIAGFTMGQHSSRRWRSSRFFFTRRLQGRKRFFRRDFAGLSGSHSARWHDVPRRSGRRPRPRPWSLDCRARRWPVPRRSRVR